MMLPEFVLRIFGRSFYFAIFEPGIDIGNSIPVYTTFEFVGMPKWLQVSEQKIQQLQVVVSDINLVDEASSPKLSATIKNNSLFYIPELNVIALLYDGSGNVVSASRTYLDQLRAEETANINFTWPEPITEKVVTKEIIPVYNIFKVELR